MKHTFVVEGKAFHVSIKQQEVDGETKYVLIINKDQISGEMNTDSTSTPKPINLFNVSSEENIPEYWNTEGECLNWVHNWVDRNHLRL